MAYLNYFIAAVCLFGVRILASDLNRSSKIEGIAVTQRLGSVTTPAPSLLEFEAELRKRQTTLNSGQICGYSNRGSGSITRYCASSTEKCTATILPNGQAYQYCYNSNTNQQLFVTTAYNTFDVSQTKCPTLALCCPSYAPGVLTNYFVDGGYTVTGWDCYKHESTQTFTSPNPAVLNPSGFSVTLAQLEASSSSSSFLPTSASSGPVSSKPPTPSSSAADSSKAKSSGSGGLSSGTKIGIGAGVGAGIGVLLIGAIVFLIVRRHNKKKKERAIAEVSPAYESYRIGPSKGAYNPAMSHDHAQYYGQGPNPEWSPQPPYSPGGYQDTEFPTRQTYT